MSTFIPSQIVCLDNQDKSLYCEVIDVISSRQMCWVRPVILVNLDDNSNNYFHDKNNIYDLRFTSDLLWKLNAFRIVLDTEYIQFFASLQEFEFDEEKLLLAKQKLKLFIQEICFQNKIGL
ncbi:MAG: hypothetical protein GW795_05345 [Cyanobacteria bacterium]|uniref:hypothetical protein n=1 Tax=Geminocystis sp. TaxID=2664100 RepID=UPI001DA1A030|nr:hypothetical protein [Cyanobacteria bacterium CG_2015-16_32_12]NCO77693.1 hypothetical protein [Cyanobacteria bacterium CG_2015-22_32_23]NCQ04332.1 hypothetical protein [Cyanobacteria bacterium CG_2015-09_32_10]NCQ41312.1 hypothetical protein [Cyanobacteria bacterium CG_2015-04_32_10]NCS83640.1 hypothetical protein [Cyanobacteria bacterium CG_2015-02_32_10]